MKSTANKLRIAIDLQGMQTASSKRGIGRYSFSLTNEIIKSKEHDIFILLDQTREESFNYLKNFYIKKIPEANIKIWSSIPFIHELHPENNDFAKSRKLRLINELILNNFIESLDIDVLIITSFFEHYAVTSIPEVRTYAVIPIIYDFIPLVTKKDSLVCETRENIEYFTNKLNHLKNADLFFCISEQTKKEALFFLKDQDKRKFINISTSSDILDFNFNYNDVPHQLIELAKEPYIYYTGASEYRKNLKTLISAFAILNQKLNYSLRLFFSGDMDPEHVIELKQIAKEKSVEKYFYILGHVNESTLIYLYKNCSMFVFPSLYEGFGMPVLEAIKLGVPVLTSNQSSMRDIIKNDKFLFNPNSVKSVAFKMNKLYSDQYFRRALLKHNNSIAQKYSWPKSADIIIKSIAKFKKHITYKKLKFVAVEDFQEEFNKILLLKLDHMGDFVIALPAIARLKEKYPSAKIDIIVGSWNKEFAEQLKIFDNIYVYDFFKKKSSDEPEISDSETYSLINNLGYYDLAIDLRRHHETRFLLEKIRAKYKACYDSFDQSINNSMNLILKSQTDTPYKLNDLNKKNMGDQLLNLVDSLPYALLKKFRFNLRKNNSRTLIAIFPCAGGEIKEWSASNYRLLIERLVKLKTIDLVYVFFPTEDKQKAFNIKANKKIKFFSALTFDKLVTTLSECTLSIGNNSFSAHIPDYIGICSLNIYGRQSSIYEWAPKSKDSYLIFKEVPCANCYIGLKKDCHYNVKCLDIPVDYVYDKAVLLIDSVKTKKINSILRDSPIFESNQSELIKAISNLCNEFSDSDLNFISHFIARNNN